MICVDNVLYRPYGTSSYEVIGINEPATKVRVVSHIDGVVVKAIAKDAFMSNKTLHEIELPDSIESIYERAFFGCENLRKVSFYNSTNRFGMLLCHPYAFCGCRNLLEIIYQNPQIFLPAYKNKGHEFDGCENLVRFDGHLGHLTNSLFADCPNLEELTFCKTVEFDATAMDGCDGLRTVTFLGVIKENAPKNILEIMQTLKIKCTPKFNYQEWVYDGAYLEYIE